MCNRNSSKGIYTEIVETLLQLNCNWIKGKTKCPSWMAQSQTWQRNSEDIFLLQKNKEDLMWVLYTLKIKINKTSTLHDFRGRNFCIFFTNKIPYPQKVDKSLIHKIKLLAKNCLENRILREMKIQKWSTVIRLTILMWKVVLYRFLITKKSHEKENLCFVFFFLLFAKINTCKLLFFLACSNNFYF